MKALTEVLKSLITQHGIEILQQEQRLKAMLGDLLPQEIRLRYLLELSLRAGIPKKLIELQKENPSMKETNISSMKHYFKEEYFLEDKAVKAVFDCWVELLPKIEGESDTVTDIDGNVYKTVRIGNQVWMAENLRVSRYRNGDLIPNIKDNNEWAKLKTGAWCNYDNNPENDADYGKLYNWYTVGDERSIAPKGWHIPTDNEWSILIDLLGGENIAGRKLKEKGTAHWEAPNRDATNEIGFSALPGGFLGSIDGTFSYVGNYGLWWSCTANDSSYARYKGLHYSNINVTSYSSKKSYGLSVRCVRDSV